MFGGHVSAQDGKSDLEHPGIITHIVLFMEISKGCSDTFGQCPGLWHCSKKPYAHTQIYKCTHIFSSLNVFCSSLFMSLTGWIQSHTFTY